jgi:hypothetical protein
MAHTFSEILKRKLAWEHGAGQTATRVRVSPKVSEDMLALVGPLFDAKLKMPMPTNINTMQMAGLDWYVDETLTDDDVVFS